MVRRRLLDLSPKVHIPKEETVSEPAAPAVDKVLDCAGMSCPLPVLKTAQAIKELAPGQVLELLATDPGVEPDMQAWTSRTGNELLGITNQDGVFHVLIRRAR
jgi:tRNA 2-thiouridine synthesizing protein A